MRAWVYKVNSRGPGGIRDWHFNRYFRYRGRRAYSMGGPKRIRSPQSWAHLSRVRAGDLFVCYQTDERKIYGLARTAGAGKASEEGSGRYDSIDFQARGLGLQVPVDVRRPEVRERFRHIGAFTVPSRGTIHALAKDELRALLRALISSNPSQKDTIRSFARGKVR